MAIFAVPLKSSQPPGFPQVSTSRSRSNKRKRSNQLPEDEEREEDTPTHQLADPPKHIHSLEYTSVLSPLENIQRRVAGHPLVQPLPPLPFPHAAPKQTKPDRAVLTVKPAHTPRSLHLQHLAALSAIIHRSMLSQDYRRAARAMGLMLHDDKVAGLASIRNKGFMGIAAEILLRQDQGKEAQRHSSAIHISTVGLENTKRLYETLIIRHPYHKSWPESVNAIDFYLALFNIWIYAMAISDENSDSALASPCPDQLDPQSIAKLRELDQANQIVNRMDECMASIPYMDEPELIRLRAMVGLWLADLYETCHAFAVPLEQVSDSDDYSQDRPEQQQDTGPDYIRLAQESRARAQVLLSKLAGRPTSS
ncbi:uncharacterized protein A1O9_03725 [Exophiala aquamarina CBS 119918]|uniref:Uncharacterized protein n=1 Tax=Exophiala aquamarina CBS 119918 TaxID=1182545 RepID=A0A072PGL0_9EURO|nr:uncharacterized protein A1O9_03725 [Exophiala aquamarina CBS 119918]KEF58882.1 hypothetical protein A1O9_03725 [Exophiala aquamarina CBS 119918]